MTVAYAVLIISAAVFLGLVFYQFKSSSASAQYDMERSLTNLICANDRDALAKFKKLDIEVGHLRGDLALLRDELTRMKSQPKRVSHYHYHDKVPVPRRQEIRA